MTAHVPFLALERDYDTVREAVRERFERVLASQVFVLGPETTALEAALARICGARHAIACSSGTDALYLALLACGVGAGDAVVVPAFTFFATAGAVRRAGALPVFADVGAETFNSGQRELEATLDRDFTRSEGGLRHRRTGARLRALIIVHLFGRAASTSEACKLAGDAGAHLIEDAAQAIGAASVDGAVGSTGAVGCLSFYPSKNLGGAGDGGAVITSDGERADLLRRLRTHGAMPGDPLHNECGINARLGELQAAYLNAKLAHLDEWTAARAKIASNYRERLQPLAERGSIALPPAAEPPAHVWHQFVVRIATGREAVRERMNARGVDTRVFYPVPLHLQPCFADLGYRSGDLPVAERLAREALSLPLFPSLTAAELERVCAALTHAVAG